MGIFSESSAMDCLNKGAAGGECDAADLRILIVDDDVLTAGLMAALLEKNGFKTVGSAANGLEGIETYKECRPDYTLMDIGMPVMNGIDATRHIVEFDKDAKILAVTGYAEIQFVKGMLAAGAVGVAMKTNGVPELMSAMMSVACGKKYFSPSLGCALAEDIIETEGKGQSWKSGLSLRESEVLWLMSEGWRSKEIGARLTMAASTVDSHVRNIKKKLGAETAAEVLKVAIERKILMPRAAAPM